MRESEGQTERLAPSWRFCGLGFLWAWVALSFFSSTLYSDSNVAYFQVVWGFGTLCYALALIALIVVEAKFHPASYARPSVVVMGSIAISAGTLLATLVPPIAGSIAVGVAVQCVGIVTFGIGAAVAFVAWAKLFCSLAPRSIFFYASLSYVIMSIVHIASEWMPVDVVTALVGILPLLSALCFVSESRREMRLAQANEQSAVAAPRQLDGPVKSASASSGTAPTQTHAFRWKAMLPLVVLFFYGLCQEILRNIYLAGDGDALAVGLYCDIGVGVGGVLMLAVSCLMGMRSGQRDFINVGVLRIILVLLALAFLATSLFDGPLPLVYVVYSAGFCSLRIFTWSYVVCYAREGKLNLVVGTAATQAAVSLSAVPLMVLSLVNSSLITYLGEGVLNGITVLVLFAMVVLVSFVLNSDDLATVWGTVASEPLSQPVVDVQSYSAEDLAALREEFRLTNRESEIALLLANGRSMPWISEELCISLGTVQTHVSHIYRKMDVHSRQEFLDRIAILAHKA